MCIPLTWRDNLLITDSCQWSQHASNSTSVHFYYQGCFGISTLLLSRLSLHQYASIIKAVSASIHFCQQGCLYINTLLLSRLSLLLLPRLAIVYKDFLWNFFLNFLKITCFSPDFSPENIYLSPDHFPKKTIPFPLILVSVI